MRKATAVVLNRHTFIVAWAVLSGLGFLLLLGVTKL